MKNIQVIDSAENCGYWIYSVKDSFFKKIFPHKNQNIEFVNDFIQRVGKQQASLILNELWKKRLDKNFVNGIHGTLFYDLEYKRAFYPNKNEDDLDDALIQGGANSY